MDVPWRMATHTCHAVHNCDCDGKNRSSGGPRLAKVGHFPFLRSSIMRFMYFSISAFIVEPLSTHHALKAFRSVSSTPLMIISAI
jgi:hypothetical protein